MIVKSFSHPDFKKSLYQVFDDIYFLCEMLRNQIMIRTLMDVYYEDEIDEEMIKASLKNLDCYRKYLEKIINEGNLMNKESKGQRKVHKVMREMKEGKLHSGSKKGPIVKNPKQGIAIALSEARKVGAKVPKK